MRMGSELYCVIGFSVIPNDIDRSVSQIGVIVVVLYPLTVGRAYVSVVDDYPDLGIIIIRDGAVIGCLRVTVLADDEVVVKSAG